MFENVIGHENNIKLLLEEINSGNVSHAYLFIGKKGIGKATVAKEFAKELLKVKNLESSPDFKYISKRDDKKEIVIEQIREELIEEIYTVPVSGDKKVYIIDDAECLNIASQNALLKTLEEPPKYVVLLLISSNSNAFLTTVMSRVKKISFNGIENEKLKEYIFDKYNINLNENILEYIDGSIGNAIEIVDKKIDEKFLAIDKLYKYLEEKDVVSALKVSESIDFSEYHMLEYLEYILYKNFKLLCTKFVEKAVIRLKYNGNYDIVIDNMILNIIDNI